MKSLAPGITCKWDGEWVLIFYIQHITVMLWQATPPSQGLVQQIEKYFGSVLKIDWIFNSEDIYQIKSTQRVNIQTTTEIKLKRPLSVHKIKNTWPKYSKPNRQIHFFNAMHISKNEMKPSNIVVEFLTEENKLSWD